MPSKKSFLLRIDPQTYDALQRWANDELRSLNGQIEYLLREALRDAGRLKGPPARAVTPASKSENPGQRTDPFPDSDVESGRRT